jgi:hypothetical protein
MKEPGFDEGGNLLAEPQDLEKSRYRLNRGLLFAPLAGYIGTIVVMLIYPPVDRRLFTLISFFLLLPSAFLIGYVQRKQKRGDDVSSFFPMTTLLALVPLCAATALLANGALDRLPVDAHPLVITAKLVRRGKSASYYLQVQSWRPNRSFEELQVPYRVYAQFQTNDPVVVEVHRGALGIPWLGEIRQGP